MSPLLILLPLVVLVVLCALTPLVMKLYRQQQLRLAETQAAWGRVAKELGGAFSPPEGPWYRRSSSRIDAELEGVPVKLDVYVVSTGQSTQTYTRATASTTSEHRFSMSPQCALAGIGRVLGLQDVEVGDPEYDDAFVIKTDDPQWLTYRLSRELRKSHLKVPRAVLGLKKGKVTAVVHGHCGDEQQLRGLLELVAAASLATS